MSVLREKLDGDGILLGTHIFIGDPSITECMAMVGYDVMWIDTEHTAIEKERLINTLIAARAGGTPSMVRIPWNDKVLAKPVLDMGSDAILFPNVRTPDEAREAVRACEYPPDGERGYGPLRALGYGEIRQSEYVTKRYRETLRFIQIEDIMAVERLDEICEVPGMDGFIVGPNDLSASMGHLDNTLHPEMLPVYDRIGEITRRHGKVLGVSVGYDSAVVRAWKARGVKLIFCGSDISHIHDGAKRTLEKMKLDTGGKI